MLLRLLFLDRLPPGLSSVVAATVAIRDKRSSAPMAAHESPVAEALAPSVAPRAGKRSSARAQLPAVAGGDGNVDVPRCHGGIRGRRVRSYRGPLCLRDVIQIKLAVIGLWRRADHGEFVELPRRVPPRKV